MGFAAGQGACHGTRVAAAAFDAIGDDQHHRLTIDAIEHLPGLGDAIRQRRALDGLNGRNARQQIAALPRGEVTHARGLWAVLDQHQADIDVTGQLPHDGAGGLLGCRDALGLTHHILPGPGV
ncbi:hypothetical protein D3C80_1673190 [compost metagenome]